jgi:hypothetical protein
MNGITKAQTGSALTTGQQAHERSTVSEADKNAFLKASDPAGNEKPSETAPEKTNAELLAEASRSLRFSMGMKMQQTAAEMGKTYTE